MDTEAFNELLKIIEPNITKQNAVRNSILATTRMEIDVVDSYHVTRSGGSYCGYCPTGRGDVSARRMQFRER